MISSVLIIAFSFVLLVYWFRYTSILILHTRTSVDYSPDVVAANNLLFPEVQTQLAHAATAPQLSALHESLARDYRLLTYLLRHTAGASIDGFPLEQRVLMLDFRVMQVFYALTNGLGLPQAKAALEEMAQILRHLSNAMGERAAANSRA